MLTPAAVLVQMLVHRVQSLHDRSWVHIVSLSCWLAVQGFMGMDGSPQFVPGPRYGRQVYVTGREVGPWTYLMTFS